MKWGGVAVGTPVVHTKPIDTDQLTSTSAVSGGTVSADQVEILSRGVCWDTDPTPEVSDNRTVDGAGTGSFTSNLSNLQPATSYYLRAYAMTDQSVYYGDQLVFTTFPPEGEGTYFTDKRDGQRYRTVNLGSQTWMAQNLAYLPEVSPHGSGSSSVSHYYVVDYGGTDPLEARQSETYNQYGVLYNWTAAQNACPDGWHLPTDEEWITLEGHLGMSAEELQKRRFRNSGEVGSQLKAKTVWPENGVGIDSHDFTILPAGYRGGGQGFVYVGSFAAFWTASISGNTPWYRGFFYFNDGSYRETWSRSDGFSIRCVKNH